MNNIKDLVNAGKLVPGTKIVWRRRSLSENHVATINVDGTITTSDGRKHKTPSGAAKYLNDNKPVDGWLVWKIEGSGASLGSLRE